MKKTVLITGASRGIGAQMAREFHKNGYNVAINYNKSEEKAIELSKELEGSLLVRGDVACEDDVKRMIDKVLEHFGSIDVLVNNAGISSFNLVSDISLDEWENLFKVNVTGTFLACKYVSKHMVQNHSGCIINMASIWGISGSSCESAYSASKGAVIAFTKSLAKELGPSNIRVNAIAPGFIDTDMNKCISKEDTKAFTDETPLGRIGTPKDVADLAVFLAGEGSSFITGQIIACDGGAII